DPNASETHLPVPSPPAPAGTGPSLTAQGIGGDWSTAAYRHDRINPADPHIGQSFLAYISGHRFSFLPSSLSPGWLHLLRLDTIPQVESERARWLPTGRRKLGRRWPVPSNFPLGFRLPNWCFAKSD